MSMQYMEWIEKYNLNFHLYISESESVNIYKESNLKQIAGDLKELNGGFVDVIATKKLNLEYIFKVSYEGKTIGWCSPRESVKVFKTKTHEIKLFEDVVLSEEVNSKLGIDIHTLNENKMKILKAGFYSVIDDKVYMGITLKETLIGFVELKHIKFFTNTVINTNVITESIRLYNDSKLSKELDTLKKEETSEVLLLGGFEDDSAVRIRVKGKRYWINSSDLEHKISHNRVNTLNDVVMDSLLFQLNNKLNKVSEFYIAKLNRLEQENKKILDRETKINKNLAAIKDLL